MSWKELEQLLTQLKQSHFCVNKQSFTFVPES